MRTLYHRYNSLTPREQELMKWVVSGLLNKQITAESGISEIMIKVHRGQVMQKMQAESLADLVRMSEKLAFTARQEIIGDGGSETQVCESIGIRKYS